MSEAAVRVDVRARWRDAIAIGAVALGVRLAVVAWAAARFPPAADGAFYHRIAERIAAGLGSTWLWPDGAVTYVAHYPIGYPAAIGAAYAALGARPAVAMALNAVLGAIGAVAAHGTVAASTGSRRAAAVAGLLVAMHPGLVAYTPAIMTEGVTAALVACAAWAAIRARRNAGTAARGAGLGALVVVGLVVGAATLVRPQTSVLAPLLGLFACAAASASASVGADADARDGAATRGWRARRAAAAAIVTTAVAVAVCVPWTLRNCARMHRCALVSVNGGWNLLIGADLGGEGTWSALKVPAACAEVWDEAAKDDCFARAARATIAEHPFAWAALAPRKVAATFDYAGAAGWYLHESNPSAFGEEAKVALGAIETLYERAVLALALAAVASSALSSARRLGRAAFGIAAGLAVVGAAFAVLEHAWVSHATLVVLALGTAASARSVARMPAHAVVAALAIAATMATHAVFFGAGRYSLVVMPVLCAVAAPALVQLLDAASALARSRLDRRSRVLG